MSLKKLKLPTHTVKIDKLELTFHGLSFNDITGLIKNNRELIEDVYSKGRAIINSADSNDGQLNDLLEEVVMDTPVLAATIIAYSAGEPDAIEEAAKIPFPIQVDLLDKILTLTFSEVGGVGKFVPMLIKILNKLTGAMNQINSK